MQETRDKAILVKPIKGMTQFQEALSVEDSEFRLLSGVYPKEAGIQARMPGKTRSNTFGSSVLSIGDFLGTRIIQTSSSGLFKEDEAGTFATLQNAAATQNKNRDSYAASPGVQLLIRANGEEPTQVIDTNGNIFKAEIPKPAAAPTVAQVAGGTLVQNKWYCWVYCYAASTAYPYVERTTSINGQICPRGNPSAFATKQIVGATNKTVRVTFVLPTRADLDEIWIFRTTAYATQAEAENAAKAGLLYFKGKVQMAISPGVTSYDDGDPIVGVDQVENDNYGASTFKNVIYYDPYWIGFGNDIFRAQVTWTNGGTGVGIITLTGPSVQWWNGRDDQPFKLTGVTTGGIDGKGTFKFKYISSTTATIQTGTLPIMSAGTKFITISPSTTTIYRSKSRDPFAWGWTRVVGTLNEALEWALKIGGGTGTAIATIPNESILKVDTEFPTRSYAFNLQLIGDFDQFKQTQKTISETFSVSSQSSQFPAQTKDGNAILWGMDYKSFTIVECNGITMNSISFPVQSILRNLTITKSDQVLCHGIYDPLTQCNCIWLTLKNSPSRVHYMIYQHAPTGFWGVVEDLDVLCSARVQDITTGLAKIMVGTEYGLYGQAFVDGVYQNWVQTPDPTTAVVTSATNISVTTSASSFDLNALKGCWVLITDANDQNEQWARVSAITLHQLTFDRVYANGQRFATLQIVPSAGWKVYIGLIECRGLKYFDFKTPNSDKKLVEIWVSQEGTTSAQPTILRLYREWETTLLAQLKPARDNYKNGTPSTSFIEKKPPSELLKSLGLEVINREYAQWILRNIVLKYETVY